MTARRPPSKGGLQQDKEETLNVNIASLTTASLVLSR
jgi:hypothetical protein